MAQKPFPSYPGGKDAAGVAERLISMMPRHSVYVEPFIGGGALLRHKPPALRSIGIDADGEVVDAWRRVKWPALELIHGDGIAWLESDGLSLPFDALVYCDPPYLPETRSRKRIYRHEMDHADHVRLLAALEALPCSVMISGYASGLYEFALADWKCERFNAMTRGGVREEVVWSRSSIGSYGVGGLGAVGHNFRERERIKRKVARWRAKFGALPEDEQAVVLAALLEVRASADLAIAG